MLSEKEKQRYVRHILLKEIGREGQLKLKNSKVLVVGAGGLGCPVLQYLAAAGVGKLGIIDHDLVEVSNLQRQILYSEKDIDRSKAVAAKQRLQEMNASIEIIAITERLAEGNALRLFREYDIIVEGSDSFSTKYLANDAAVLAGKPLVMASIFKFEGQISVYNYEEGPTYRCLFPEPAAPEEMPSCIEVGVLGILPGIIGSLQANEVLKIILGIGNILSGQLLVYNSLSFQQQLFPFCKNPDIRISVLKEIDLSCTIPEPPSISFEDYKRAPENYTVLDVRTPEERAAFYIGGIHIPLQKLEARANELASKDHLLVVCASGKRSLTAITLLRGLFPKKNYLNLEGGLNRRKPRP